MIYSRKYNYLFVSTPKSGTHTMYEVLQRDWDGARVGHGFHPYEIPKDIPNDAWTFSVCRHPLDRVVAAWNYLCFQDEFRKDTLERCGTDSFEDFARWALTMPNDRRLYDFGGVDTISSQTMRLTWQPDQWIKIEAIEQEFQSLPFVDKPQAFPKLNSRPHKPWQEVISPSLADDLTEHYKHDFEVLGYEH